MLSISMALKATPEMSVILNKEFFAMDDELTMAVPV
jgi:hypothetical protein